MTTTHEEFKKLFAYATGLYANAGTHEGSINSYWGFLKSFSLPVLREAFKRACESSSEFFPSAVRVRDCATAAAKTAALPKADYSRPALPQSDREFVPAFGAGHEEWIAEGTNGGERLARLWQVESKHYGWDRGVEMPIEIGKQRLRALSQLTDKIGSKTARTNGERQTGSGSKLTGDGSSASPQSTASSAGAQSHGDGCVCERCMPAVMRAAEKAGLVR